MANLKDLRNRIGSVKSTRKITSAMKMVAASKLRQSHRRAEAAQPYEDAINKMLARTLFALEETPEAIAELGPLIAQLDKKTPKTQHETIVLVTGDRGLCGAFNTHIVRKVKQHLNELKASGVSFTIACIGIKGFEALNRDYEPMISHHIALADTEQAPDIMRDLVEKMRQGRTNKIICYYNKFVNIMTQKPSEETLAPFDLRTIWTEKSSNRPEGAQGIIGDANGWDSFMPNAATILPLLIAQALSAKMMRMVFDVAAGEQAARMTAMDGATRNAGKMIDDLTLTYNRQRQAAITREVTEIVSAAEAI